MDAYNYVDFVMANEEPAFAAFPSVLPAGSAAPSFPLHDLATGRVVELAELWRHDTVIMEFGSFT